MTPASDDPPSNDPPNFDPQGQLPGLMDAEAERAAKIAALNDAFRTTSTCGVVFSRTLAAEGRLTMLQIMAHVRAFTDFTPDNDPHREHEFGSFQFPLSMGSTPTPQTIFWKIDTYADGSLTFGADDPLDPACVRILTIMHASDY